MHRIVGGEVQSAALLALDGPAGDEIAHVDHVAQFADILRSLHALEQVLGLFVEHVQTVPGALQSEVGAHDAHIVRHNLVHLPDALGDQHLLLVGHRTLVVPFGHLVVEVVFIHMRQRVLGSRVGIYHGFDERVRGQTVAAVQTCARTFAEGIQAVDR